MLCTIKMLPPGAGNFTLPGSRLDKSLNHVDSVSHLPQAPEGVNPLGLRPGILWQMNVMFHPLAGSGMFMCQWTLIQIISLPLNTMVRSLSVSSLMVWLPSQSWVNPNSSKPRMALHIFQLLFRGSVRPIRSITPLVFLTILKGRP
jgi:hypothetical protein